MRCRNRSGIKAGRQNAWACRTKLCSARSECWGWKTKAALAPRLFWGEIVRDEILRRFAPHYDGGGYFDDGKAAEWSKTLPKFQRAMVISVNPTFFIMAASSALVGNLDTEPGK